MYDLCGIEFKFNRTDTFCFYYNTQDGTVIPPNTLRVYRCIPVVCPQPEVLFLFYLVFREWEFISVFLSGRLSVVRKVDHYRPLFTRVPILPLPRSPHTVVSTKVEGDHPPCPDKQPTPKCTDPITSFTAPFFLLLFLIPQR